MERFFLLKNPKKLLVCGSRTINNKKDIYRVLDNIMAEFPTIDLILNGGAKGVDTIASEYAIEKNIKLKLIKPDWKRYGKYAGIKRNTQLVNECDVGIAFWDRKSRGTKDTIDKLYKANKLLFVVIMNGFSTEEFFGSINRTE